MSSQTDLHERLYAVYRHIQRNVVNADGLGGPVYHEAKVGSWTLFFRSSSWGELTFSADSGDGLRYSYIAGPDDKWVVLSFGTPKEIIPWLVSYAERATWKDKLYNRGKDAPPLRK